MIEEAVRLVIILLCTVCAVFVSTDAQRHGMTPPLGTSGLPFQRRGPADLFLRANTRRLCRGYSINPGPGRTCTSPTRHDREEQRGSVRTSSWLEPL